MTGAFNMEQRPGVPRSRRQRLHDFWHRAVIQATLLDLSRARLLRDQPSVIDDLIEIGRRRLKQYDFEQASSPLLEAHNLAAKIGYASGIARAQVYMAEAALGRGDAQSAEELLETELPRLRAPGADVRLPYVLCLLGEALLARDRPTAAMSVFGEANSVAERTGDWQQMARALCGIGMAAYEDTGPQFALESWTAALDIYQSHRDVGGVAYMQHWLSIATGSMGRVDKGRQYAVESIRNYEKAGRPDIAEDARSYLAEIDKFIAEGGIKPLGEEP